jgi:hypothetical protein
MLKEELFVPIKNKKTYQQPALRVYGNIVSITASAGPVGMTDGSSVAGHMMTG